MSDTPRITKALAKTQGLFRAAAEANGFADEARQLERELVAARETQDRFIKAAQALLDDEWRMSCEWGPRDERNAIIEEFIKARALLTRAVPTPPAEDKSNG